MNIDLSSSEEILGRALQVGIKKGFIDKNKTYIVTAGYPAGIEGSTNFLHILKKEQMEYYLKLCFL